MTENQRSVPPSKDATLHKNVEGRRIAAGTISLDDFTYSIVEAEPRPVPKRRPAVIDPIPGATRGATTKERRGENRTRTRLRDGVLAEGRGRVLCDCQIRDRSKRGARLQLDSDTPLPQRFLLADPASKTRFRAALVWQDGRDAGVRLAAVE